MSNRRNPRLRLYIRLDGLNQAIPGSSLLRFHKPRNGKWVDITNNVGNCCLPVSDGYGEVTVMNSNTGGIDITAISVKAGSLDGPTILSFTGLSYGESADPVAVFSIPIGIITVTIDTNGTSPYGVMTATVTGGSGTVDLPCFVTVNGNYQFEIDTIIGGETFTLTLTSSTVCPATTTTTTSTSSTTTTTTTSA